MKQKTIIRNNLLKKEILSIKINIKFINEILKVQDNRDFVNEYN